MVSYNTILNVFSQEAAREHPSLEISVSLA